MGIKDYLKMPINLNIENINDTLIIVGFLLLLGFAGMVDKAQFMIIGGLFTCLKTKK